MGVLFCEFTCIPTSDFTDYTMMNVQLIHIILLFLPIFAIQAVCSYSMGNGYRHVRNLHINQPEKRESHRVVCPSNWTNIDGTCFSPPRKTYEWTKSTSCLSNCDAVVELCTDVGAELATKDETHAWLDNGGDRLGMKYGLTSTMFNKAHWFTQNLGDYG